MKKTLTFLTFATLLMTSCTKTFNCQCVTEYDSSLGMANSTTTIPIQATKSDAKAVCEGTSVSIPGSYTQTCTLQ